MRISLPFGKEEIELNIPEENLLDILSAKSSISSMDEKSIIAKALSSPIKSNTLDIIARDKYKACILVSDITRPCPSYKFLPALVDELKKGGIAFQNIKVIIGLGIHRRLTENERRKLVGDYIFKNIKVINSSPSRSRANYIGKTSRGTPIEVFEEALGNDILIATGNIEYHWFAGYSGGAKALMPGTCSRNSIQVNHSMMLDKGAETGRYIGNPVREDMEEAGNMVGIDFIFNVILDDDKKIISAFAGRNNEAWLEGIKEYDRIYMREVDRQADIVIASAGGFPKDINLYQSQKGLENIKDVARSGGIIILVASCYEGFGDVIFERWMGQVKNFNAISKRLKEKFVLGGHKAVAVSRIISDKEVFLYSKFDRKTTVGMGFYKIDDIQSYLDKVIQKDSQVKITVVPSGRFVRLKK
jgi:lactate racemase